MVPRSNKTKTNAQYFLPEIYIASLTKGKNINSVVSIEDLISTRRTMQYDIKQLLICYGVIIITLVWGAQVKLNSKLLVNRKANDTSPEKVFQQTQSHSVFVKIISHSQSAKILLSSVSIQRAINKDYYGLTDDERTDEGYLNAVINDLDNLIDKKGSGALNVYVKDADSRRQWLRASNSSLRSTWCAAPTYSPSKLASTSISIKTTKPENIMQFIDKVLATLSTEGIIIPEEVPTKDEIIDELKETLEDMNIELNIDDSTCGTTGSIPLESMIGFSRNSIVSSKTTKALPGIAQSLKSSYARKSKQTENKAQSDEKEN
jgi:hypothetical protein